MHADHFDFDTFWKITRGRSVILEGYKDEIATSKHKAARTLVHKSQWLPYGQRPSQDQERAEYGQQLLSLLKGLVAGAKGPEMLKVISTRACPQDGTSSLPSTLQAGFWCCSGLQLRSESLFPKGTLLLPSFVCSLS